MIRRTIVEEHHQDRSAYHNDPSLGPKAEESHGLSTLLFWVFVGCLFGYLFVEYIGKPIATALT